MFRKACGSFALLSFAANADFIGPDKYGWGLGYYAIIIAFVIIFFSAIRMRVKKTAAIAELKAGRSVQPEV